ncbi:MAG: carboxypeptidase [Microbacteriaceae bacterium]|nr:carboxypeptidase [Microbacteriaceae bacterium]
MSLSAADRLAQLVRIPTVSRLEDRDEAPFRAFAAALERLYPLVAARLERETVGRHAVLYRWAGGAAAPILLLAHCDVVPADGGGWSRDPFAGTVADGAVHGRGALDDKGAVVAILDAIEGLLAEGFTPSGDVLLALGDDEEARGSGARAVAALLEERGVRPALVLDEGGAVVEGMLPAVRGPIALLGVTEKGVATVRLTVTGSPGHAATPPPRSAPGRLARALVRIERHRFPARTTPVVRAMGRALAPRVPRVLAAVAAGTLAGPALGPLLGIAGGAPAALVRTTAAVTQLAGGVAPNVLAAEASALLNLRIAPGDTVAGAVARLRRLIRDPAVRIEVLAGEDPPPVSRADGPAWDRVCAALASAHPEALPVPYVMIQASDSRHFAAGCDAVYRFRPFTISAAQLAAIHGVDESLDVAALERGVAFHRALLLHP